MVLKLLLVALLAGQAAPPETGPATAELRLIREADQKDRTNLNLSREEWEKISERDRSRLARVRQLLTEDKVVTREDFGIAALIFQHGETDHDIQAAHELYVVNGMMGELGNGPAISEDRFLDRIGQKQRFGCQYSLPGPDGKVTLKSEPIAGPAAVTDPLRLDFMVPPLQLAREKGMEATKEAMSLIVERLTERVTGMGSLPKDRPVSLELAKMDTNGAARARVLEIYAKDDLWLPADYFHAARVLSSSSDPQELLLAHELATVALLRKHTAAKDPFTRSWDKFLKSAGRAARYSGEGLSGIAPGVRRALELS